MTKVFFDFEFTGLHQNTTPISLGMISECGIPFYAEFTDFDKRQIDNWLLTNVIPHLHIQKYIDGYFPQDTIVGDKEIIVFYLKEWLAQFENVELWGDHLAYDWMLLCELFGGGVGCLPKNIYYIPFDICTMFKCVGVDPDISRLDFSGFTGVKHNSLNDARMIRACYKKAQERMNW